MFDLFLHCILFSLFFLFLLLWYFLFWIYGYLSKQLSKIRKLQKKTKMKNAEKKDNGTITISTGVLTNSVCVSLYFACFAENTIKIGVSPPPPQKKKTN